MNAKDFRKVPAERTEQIALIEWWDRWALSSHGTYQPEQLFHVPNEGKRGDIQGWLMKRQGVRAGVPDLILAIPAGKYHGLYIEMKSVKGRATPQQQCFLTMLSNSGYATAVCKGFEVARRVILDYLEGDYIVDNDDEE